MVFGTQASNASASSVPQAAGPSPKATMVFGGVPAAAAKNQTMMFGTPAANAVEGPPVTAPAPAVGRSTMVFGTMASNASAPAAEAPGSVGKQTMMFGTAASNTVIPPADETILDRTKSPSRTVAFGNTPGGAVPDAAASKNQTIMFGRSVVAPDDDSKRKTEVVSSPIPGDATLPHRAMAREASKSAAVVDLPPLGPALLAAPGAAVELPPEPAAKPASKEILTSQASLEDAAALRAARSNGAGRIIVIILAIVAVALAGMLIYRLLGRDFFGSAGPTEALRSTHEALAALRLDDQTSQNKALVQLKTVLFEHPGLPETQGALVIASAIRFDDVQGEVTRASATLRELRARNGTSGRIPELERFIREREKTAEVLKAELNGVVSELNASIAHVEAGSDAHLALLRAEGLARGILGDSEALTRAEAFRQQTKVTDDWVELIEPEYALNGGSSVDQAIIQLGEVKKRAANSTFLRPYVLLARLKLKKGEWQGAREELEQVVTMNDRHEIARALLADLSNP